MFKQVKFIYHLLKFSKDVRNTKEVFRFTDALLAMSSKAQRDEFGAELLLDPAARQMFDSGNSKYLYEPFDLAQLRRCKPGTLGKAYATMMDSRKLEPEFFDYNKVHDVASYFLLRMRKTHDLHHLVTGFSTEETGELGLQGFYLGQWHSGLPLAISTSVLLWTIAQDDRLLIKAMVEEFLVGYQAGRTANKVQGVVWEELWNLNLGDVQKLLRIKTDQAFSIAA